MSNPCFYNIPDGVAPDLTFYYNGDNVIRTELSKNDPITNYVTTNKLYSDFECRNEIGYFQINAIFDSNTLINSGIRNYFLPQGIVTENLIVKKLAADQNALEQVVISDIIAGTGDFLGSRGFIVLIVNDVKVNSLKTVLVYFEKCKK